MLAYHQWGPASDNHLRAISQEPSINKISLKITSLDHNRIPCGQWVHPFDTSRPEQTWLREADNIFKGIFLIFYAIIVALLSKPDAIKQSMAGLILGLRLANERRCYFVTTSLIGWAQG